jgi:hypothetical protein
VHDVRDFTRANVGKATHFIDTSENTNRGVGRGRRSFGTDEPSTSLINKDQISKSSADINSKFIGHRRGVLSFGGMGSTKAMGLWRLRGRASTSTLRFLSLNS